MQTPMKSVALTAEHQRLRLVLIDTIKREAPNIPADEILALLAYTVGQLVAMQDQRKMTPQMALELVANNVEQGNADFISGLSRSSPGVAPS